MHVVNKKMIFYPQYSEGTIEAGVQGMYAFDGQRRFEHCVYWWRRAAGSPCAQAGRRAYGGAPASMMDWEVTSIASLYIQIPDRKRRLETAGAMEVVDAGLRGGIARVARGGWSEVAAEAISMGVVQREVRAQLADEGGVRACN
jgi:hypothetical protein